MCNYLHSGSQPIPAKGVGWKVFSNRKKGTLRQFNLLSPYRGDIKVGIPFLSNWEEELRWLGQVGDGFCFFRTREEAREYRKHYIRKGEELLIASYDNYTIRKIQYKEGIGKHQERLSGYSKEGGPIIQLCRWFKVVN